MKPKRKFLFTGLVVTIISTVMFANLAFAASVIDTLPGRCNNANTAVQAAGGTFVATDTRLKEFTIRTQANNSAHAYEIVPIVLPTDASGVPVLDTGAALWTDHVILTEWTDQQVTFAPDIPLTVGETYFVGLDYGYYGGTAPDNWALYCETGDPIPDGQLWFLNGIGEWVQTIADNDIAARIVMTNGDGTLNLFNETFFKYPTGPLLLPPEPHTTDTTSGPAELGKISIINAQTFGNQTVVQEDGWQMPGKSLLITSETPTLTTYPLFTGRVEPLPAGQSQDYGTYEVSWTSVCDSTTASSCDQGFIEIYGWNTFEQAATKIFDIAYEGTPNDYITFSDHGLNTNAPTGLRATGVRSNHFLLRFTIDPNPANNSLELFVYNYEAGEYVQPSGVVLPLALNPNFTTIDSIRFGISPSDTESYAISDIKIVKLTDDIDADRVEDSVDNCLVDPNPGQGDRDNDDIGDVCDACPLTAACPPDPELIPTGDSTILSPDGLVEACFQWPVPNYNSPTHLIKPDCYNVQFELLDTSGNPLQPNCLTPPAYDIDSAVPVSDCSGPDGCCVQCDLTERFPQLPSTDSFDGITFAPIAYESYIVDPWLDPATGKCLDEVAGIQRLDFDCLDVWIGRIELEPPTINNDPTANDDSPMVNEDSGANTIDVLANDSIAPDTGETLTIISKTDGSSGTVAITNSGADLTYTPNADYFGDDSFTYTISDGNGGEATATVTVTVKPINDPPTANNDTAFVDEDSGANTIDVLANDSIAPDSGETLTIISKTEGTFGTVAITNNGADLTYTPTVVNHTGPDSFFYSISDGNGGEATAEVNIDILLHYDWGGFFSPIDPDPAVINKVKAGRSIPVKFRLDGDRGLDVLATGSPYSVEVTISAEGEVNEINDSDVEAVTAGKSGLSYDPTADLYTYVWKTSKKWAGQHRQLQVGLNDGEVYTATFMFAK